MIVDVDKVTPLPLAANYDVCIAGGGVAGIVLARKLASRKRRVLLLEAGGLDYSDVSQDSYKGTVVGYSYHDLDTARLRFLGGTSNHWGGWSRPLEAYDFKSQEYIDSAGWPIGRSDIQIHLSAAREILEIRDIPDDRMLEGSNGLLKEIFYHTGPGVRFNEKYRKELEANKAIDVLLNANLVDITLKPDGNGVTAFEFKGYSDNATIHRANAGFYVLALGGIENPRALLNANKQQPQGVGNGSDLVGRYFMEHPHYDIGYYVLSSKKSRFGKDRHVISPTLELMRKLGIANASFHLEHILTSKEIGLKRRAKDVAREVVCSSDIIADLVRKVRTLQCLTPIAGAGRLSVGSEQRPNPNSRVALGDEIDRFGLRRVALNWQLTRFDKTTIRSGAMEVAKYFARNDFGRIKLFDWILEERPSFPGTDMDAVGGYHHMGTTRMGESKRDGVVDRNCRVFGIDNLYIAGSSVFRTAGHTNPTLPIVQLALRLGDHLSQP